MFILIALIVLTGAVLFTTSTWLHFTGYLGWAWTVAPLALVAVFVAVIFVSFRWRHGWLRVLGIITAVAVGFLNYALVAAVFSWLTRGISRVAGLALDQRVTAQILFGAAMLVSLYGLANAARLRLTKVTVRLPNLPEAWRGRTIALVSDIHVGNIRGAAFVRRIVARLAALQPSAVLIAGDMFDGAKVDIEQAVRPWRDLHAPAGIYFVSGNHDEFNDREPYLAALRAAGVRVLQNEKVTVDGLQFVGVHDRETHRPAVYQEVLRRARIDRSQPSVLLAHQPAHLKIPEAAGISLQVSGHTHAGQFWPWSFLVKKIYGPFAYGLRRWGNLQVYTSSGAGSWGPPLRVGTRAELVLLRLEAEAASDAR